MQYINQTTMSSIPVNIMWYGVQSINQRCGCQIKGITP